MTVQSEATAPVDASVMRAGSAPRCPASSTCSWFTAWCLVRGVLRALAQQQPDVRVVGGSATVFVGSWCAARSSPDVVVTDIDLPDAQGPEVISLLRRQFPGLRRGLVLDRRRPAGAGATGARSRRRRLHVGDRGHERVLLRNPFGRTRGGRRTCNRRSASQLVRWHRSLVGDRRSTSTSSRRRSWRLLLSPLGHTNARVRKEIRWVGAARSVGARPPARIVQKIRPAEAGAQLAAYARADGVVDFTSA